MEESSEIVTFGPGASSEDEQDTEQNVLENIDQDVENSGHDGIVGEDRGEASGVRNTLEMFRREMSDFNHSLRRGFGELTEHIHDLVGVMANQRNNDPKKGSIEVHESQSKRNLRTPIDERENRNILHSTPQQGQNINSNNWREVGQQKSNMKPQKFDGKDDLEEYLAQFELVAELNNWSYRTKSLYLASSLTGDARGLINEISENDRRDFDAVVGALKGRVGSLHKAEVFRSELQTRVKGKNETIPELAQSIKKLTRKAYPSANLEVIETLALDYFIDAIPFKDIRIRLREVCPKTVSEAEKIAVRLDAVHVADRSRNCNVKTVGMDPETISYNGKIDDILKKIDRMSGEVQNLKNQNRNNNFRANGYDNARPRYGQGQHFNRGQRGFQRSDFPVRNENKNGPNSRNSGISQGNFNKSTLGGKDRQEVAFPQQKI